MATVPSTDFAADEVEIGALKDAIVVIHDGSLRTLDRFLTNPLGNAGVFLDAQMVWILYIACGFYSEENAPLRQYGIRAKGGYASE